MIDRVAGRINQRCFVSRALVGKNNVGEITDQGGNHQGRGVDRRHRHMTIPSTGTVEQIQSPVELSFDNPVATAGRRRDLANQCSLANLHRLDLHAVQPSGSLQRDQRVLAAAQRHQRTLLAQTEPRGRGGSRPGANNRDPRFQIQSIAPGELAQPFKIEPTQPVGLPAIRAALSKVEVRRAAGLPVADCGGPVQ